MRDGHMTQSEPCIQIKKKEKRKKEKKKKEKRKGQWECVREGEKKKNFFRLYLRSMEIGP